MAGTDGGARRRLARAAAVLALVLGVAGAVAAGDGGGAGAADTATRRAVMLEVDGAIGPATTDYITRALDEAAGAGDVALVILRLDTPGGLTAATRDIVRAIRSSEVPVATWVAPGGARAASAGTYILYASHVAAMAPATNVGAATPVSIGGPGAQPGGDEDGDGKDGGAGADGGDEDKGQRGDEAGADPKKRKAINDAAAWIRGLAEETGRNADWAERAVREAASITAREAVGKNVADFIAADLAELLAATDGRKVTVAGREVTLATADAQVERVQPDWRSELLAVITNPTVAYLLMMIGIYGLLLEGYNPGALVPGTVGAICLLLALYAFQVLPVNFAGLLLIALGIILIISEALMPSFGVLGFGGVTAIVVGSIILMDTDVPGFEVAVELIGSVAGVSGLIMLGIAYLALKAWRQPVVSGAEGILRAEGEVTETVGPESGRVHMLGERWHARSDRPIEPGRRVRVVQRDGLVLRVEPVYSNEE